MKNHVQLKITLRLLLVLVVIACRKDADVVPTIPPVIDTASVPLYAGSFSNGPFGSVSGTIQIVKNDSMYAAVLKDFRTSAGPDLHVYLSKEVQPLNFIDLGSLRSNVGIQAYSIPGDPDFAQYRYLLIHCKAYNHLFGSAPIQKIIE